MRTLGYELVDLDASLGRNGLLRLYIDKEPGVTLADCEYVSEQIGAFLDVEDPLPGSYTLEVSSPGIDRRLRTAAHFARFAGETAKLQLRSPKDGRRRITGTISNVEGDEITIDADDQIWHVELAEIAEARLVPRYPGTEWPKR